MDFIENGALNRSFSDPNLYECTKLPVRRKIVINEYLQYSNTSPLIRQFSCEEIYGENPVVSF